MDYMIDTIENKLKNFKGESISEFLENQIDYFTDKVLSSEGKEREHYGIQLKITSTAMRLSEV